MAQPPLTDSPARSEGLIAALSEIVGPSDVIIDPAVRASYEGDITGRFTGTSLAVVRPRDAGQCAAAVRACAEYAHAMVARGGGTGLVGGAVPQSDREVVLSLERLDQIVPAEDGTTDLLVGAGARLEAVQQAAAARGMEFPLDLGARSAATIAGLIATNAAGPLALRYGPARAHVAGLEAVLADGRTVARLSGLKDTAGYDWTQLMVGSEGTLGVITRARVRLAPAAPPRAVGLFGLAHMEDALALLGDLRRALGPRLEATDFFSTAAMELVCARRRIASPLRTPHAWYLIIQAAGENDPVAALADASRDHESDVAVADDGHGRQALWAFRDGINDAINVAGIPHKLDVSIPLARIPRFLGEVDGTIRRLDAQAQVINYGHLGDGNLHVNILGLAPDDERADDAILRLVARYGGSISAEHGIGIAKRRWIHLTRSEAELDLMRAIKSALDPRGLLAPGRVLP